MMSPQLPLRTPRRAIVTSLCVFSVCLLLVVPFQILKTHYTSGNGFLGLIYFGQRFADRQLPEVSALSPPALSPWGYDGQFYAQLALRPSLAGEEIIAALDNPSYRARRIGLPLIAGVLGLGEPGRVLHAYSLVNVAFWGLLLFVTIRCVGLAKPRDYLLLMALLWTTGTLASLTRALTDLPAAVLGFTALLAYAKGHVPAILLGMSALIKDSSVLGFAALSWAGDKGRKPVSSLLPSVLIMVLPIALWVLYVHLRISAGTTVGTQNFSYPLAAFAQKLSHAFLNLKGGFFSNPLAFPVHHLFEFLCPLSLFIQSAYFAIKAKFSSEVWRFGIGFVLLFAILGPSVWQEQFAYSRVLLPLTFAFNLLIHRHERGKAFAIWYILGNIGMSWLALEAFRGILR